MGVDFGLVASLGAWYAGNYYYNIYNKSAAKAGGGAEYAFTMALLQMVFGAIYAIFLWMAPEARPSPKVSDARRVESLERSRFVYGAWHALRARALPTRSLAAASCPPTCPPTCLRLCIWCA